MVSRSDALGWLFRDYQEKPETKIDYQSDKALDSIRQDRFKHSHYVEVLKDILTNSKAPLNIGLYGRWGVGKSSILHMLKESLGVKPYSDKFRYVEVDAWGFSEKSLQQDILVNINDQLKTYTENQLEDLLFNVRVEESVNFKDILYKYWYFPLGVAVATGAVFAIPETEAFDIVTKFAALGIFFVLGAVLSFIRFLIGSSQRIISKPISPFQFNKIYQNMVNDQKKILVVVIDNLDRCDDKVAVELLGIIQTFMTKPNCINILACDNEAIINHLRQVKGTSYSDREGNEFLSKFFQVTIRIPPFIGENLDSYAQSLIEQRSIDFDPFVKQILISGAIKNPRKINQFLNNVVALYRLAKLKEDDNKLPKGSITKRTDALTKLVVLQHEWPDFYRALEKNSEILNNEEMYLKWKDEYKEKFGKSESLEELDDFLNGTKFCFIENASSFLSLNQESYQADIPEIDKFELDVNSNKLNSVLKSIINEEDSKKEQYIKKINSLTDKHAKQMVIPTLMNCTLVQIGILEEIKDPAQRKILLANLGKHLYFTLLDHLEKYNFEKLFPVLIEIENVFANTIFEKLVELINKEDKLNLKLTELFLDYSDSISIITMNKVDEILASIYSANEPAILELIQKHWLSSTWVSNNFSKPTKLFGEFLSTIKLDNTEPDNEKLSTIENIHNTISNQEKDEFILRICQIILDAEETKAKTLPPKVFEISNNQILQKLNDYSNITTLVNAFLKSTEFNPNLEQKKQTFEFLFKIITRYNK